MVHNVKRTYLLKKVSSNLKSPSLMTRGAPLAFYVLKRPCRRVGPMANGHAMGRARPFGSALRALRSRSVLACRCSVQRQRR